MQYRMPDNIPATPQPANVAPKSGADSLQPQGSSVKSINSSSPTNTPSSTFPLPPGIRLSGGGVPAPTAPTASINNPTPVVSALPKPQLPQTAQPTIPQSQPQARLNPVAQKPTVSASATVSSSAVETSKNVVATSLTKPSPVNPAPSAGVKPPAISGSSTSTPVFTASALPKPEVKAVPPFPTIPPAKPVEMVKPASSATPPMVGVTQSGPRPMVKPGVLPPTSNPALAPNLSQASSPNPALAGVARPIPTAPQPLGSVVPSAPPKPLVSAEAPNLSSSGRMDPQPVRPAVLEKKPFPLKLLALIVGAIAIIGIIALIVRNLAGGQTSGPALSQTGGGAQAPGASQNVNLTYWGLWEPAPVMKEIFQEFQKQNPGVSIDYVQQSPKDYRERLQDALAKGTGPDLFRYHGSWVPMMTKDLATLPSSVMSEAEYNQQFYPVFGKTLKTSKGLVGIPHMYEGLGLYYNTEIFDVAKELPPKTWEEMSKTATNLTIRSKGKIEQAGVALGTATNVDNFSDILALIILQNSGYPEDLSSKNSADAYEYYVNFAKALKVWDDTLPNSTYAFATGKVAMMIAPSWRAHEVMAINPNLKFAIAPVPQLRPERQVAFASFWAEGVSSSSKNAEMAWRLLKFMSSKEMLQKFYESAAKNTPRKFGELYPRPDMANLVATDPYVASYLSDAPVAQSWYMSSRTFDSGINDKIIKYVEDAITTIYTSADMAGALTTAQQGIQQVLQTYGITPRSISTGAAPAATGM